MTQAPHDTPPGRAVVSGVLVDLAEARLAVTDEGVARGDGGFETVGVWDGRPFRLDDHLARLDRTLRAIGLGPAPLDAVRADVDRLLADVPRLDAALRVYVTGSGTRVVTWAVPPARPPLHRLAPQPAPWIRPVGTYGLAGAKVMSYGPNVAATRAAVRAGADDALLVSLTGLVLEGPTFAVLWVRGGVLYAPAVALGIVDSISRRTLLELAPGVGLAVEEGRYLLAELDTADEVLACSAVRALQSVHRIGARDLPAATPVAARLGAALDAARRRA